MSVSVERIGRRHYICGLPYDQRAAAKEQGCKWDPERRQWWTGKAEVADCVLRAAGEVAQRSRPDDAQGDRTEIIGRAKYKGRIYYLCYEGHAKSDGRRIYKLAFRDGSKVFWAQNGEPVEIVKRYTNGDGDTVTRTIGEVQQMAEDYQRGREAAGGNGNGGRGNGGRGRLVGYHGLDHCSCGNWSGVGSVCLYSYGEAKAEGEHRSIRWERE